MSTTVFDAEAEAEAKATAVPETPAEVERGAQQPEPAPVAAEKKDSTRPYIIFHEVQADVFKKVKVVIAANGEAAIKSLGEEELQKFGPGVGFAATTERGWQTLKPKVETTTRITFE